MNTSITVVYTCLSYEWGLAATTTETIKLRYDDGSNHTLDIRRNLWDFLNMMRNRPTVSSAWFWIDALCINQFDSRELNHQVQQSSSVYKQAYDVTSWLGTNPLIATFLKPHSEDGNQDAAREAFIDSPYWTRAWITQEVTLARRLKLMAGDVEAELDAVTRALKRHTYVSHILPDMPWDSAASLGIISSFNPADWKYFKGRSLIYLLDVNRNNICEKWQDRVFSLRGLSCDGVGLQVDYRYNRQQLALQVLYNCEQALCLCSFRTVAHALELGKTPLCQAIQETRRDVSDSTELFQNVPFVEWTPPRRKKRIKYVDLSELCSEFDGIISLVVGPENKQFTATAPASISFAKVVTTKHAERRTSKMAARRTRPKTDSISRSDSLLRPSSAWRRCVNKRMGQEHVGKSHGWAGVDGRPSNPL